MSLCQGVKCEEQPNINVRNRLELTIRADLWSLKPGAEIKADNFIENFHCEEPKHPAFLVPTRFIYK
jgi:hypothetical protein